MANLTKSATIVSLVVAIVRTLDLLAKLPTTDVVLTFLVGELLS